MTAFAFLEQLGDWQTYVVLGIRIAVAIVAGLVGWYLTPPVTALLHRLIVRRAASNYTLASSRLVGAGILALLAFFLLQFGLGGTGIGLGQGDGTNQVADNNDKKVEDPKTPTPPIEKPTEVLKIEVELLDDHLKRNDNKYYLIDKKGPPQSLAFLKTVIEERHGGKGLKRVVLIIYSDSVVVLERKELRDFLEKRDIGFTVTQYQKKKSEIASDGT